MAEAQTPRPVETAKPSARSKPAPEPAPAAHPEPVYLRDYRPPDWLIDEVELDFRLDEAATEVTARLQLRRNPAVGEAARPLVLDGQELELLGLQLDGEPVGANRYRIDADHLTLEDPPHALRARGAHPHPSGPQHRARGALCLRRHLLHPVRAGGLSQDHLLSRPAGRHGALPGADRGRAGALSGAARERQSGSTGASSAAAGISRSGRTRSPSRPICSPWSPAGSPSSRTLHHPLGPARSPSRSIPSPARSTNALTPWPRSRRRCAGTRSGSASNTTSISS